MRHLSFIGISIAVFALVGSGACSSDTAGGSASGTGGTTASTGATTTTSGPSSGSGGATTGPGSGGATTGPGAGGATSSSAASASGGAGGGCVNLTVKNYLSWCSVSINGNAPSTVDQTTCVAPGSVVQLVATANTGFILGPTPWHDTDGDTGSGDPGNPAGQTTETVGTSADCVWVCCPFTGGTGCPTTNQCP